MSVNELQALTQQFAEALKENANVRIYRLYTNQDS